MVKVSRDSRIWVLWLVIILGVGYSCSVGKLDWKVAAGILVTLGLPSIFSAKKGVEK
jgi:hypothetical protein